MTAIHKSDPTQNYIIQNVASANLLDLNIDLTNVDAKLFPYIKLNLNLKENIFYQGFMDGFEYIRFNNTELPEAALINSTVTFLKDTLAQGSPGSFKITSKNIGKFSMDSMLVKFTLRGGNQGSDEEQRDLSDFLRAQIQNIPLFF
ncbi:MAG: hypothetical protein IPO33_18705 [Saprospiraceae bacterium]|nr:hypothetical protein [Candidatus Brachybacter algidus]